MEVRKARLEDARGQGSCHYYCWQETYRGLISDEFLDHMSEEKNMARFEGFYHLVIGYQYVLEDNGKIVGFFDVSKSREDYAPFEVQGLYLRKAYQGKGYGKKMMEYIFSIVNGEHFYLWCLATNPTCGYYEHFGAKKVDTRIVAIGKEMYEEVCYLF